MCWHTSPVRPLSLFGFSQDTNSADNGRPRHANTPQSQRLSDVAHRSRFNFKLRACLIWIAVEVRHDLRFVTVDMIRTWAPDDFWGDCAAADPDPTQAAAGRRE